jgi:Eukaryotic aspartyl protease
MSIGNISFRLGLDTASADLFVASTACGTSTCKSVPRYPLSYQSPTFVTINNNATAFNVSFVDGTRMC